MIRFFHFVTAFCLFLTNPTLAIDANPRDRESVIQETQRFVFTINGYDRQGNFQSSGSGFAAADGRIVTNAHVVEGLHLLEILDHEGRELGIVQHVEAISFDWDLAILPRLSSVAEEGLYLTTVPVKTGQDIIVFGSPMGFYGTVSAGMISAIRELEDLTLLQMTAPISAGSSGGPVVDMDGNVCGVSTMGLNDAQNLNFAISSNEVMSLLIKQPGVYPLPLHDNDSQGNQDENVVVDSLEVISQPLDKNSTRRGVLNPVTDEFGDAVVDSWAIELQTGDKIQIGVESNEFDPKIALVGQFVRGDPQLELEDDDSGFGLNSLINWTCNQPGLYYLVIMSANVEYGSYQVSSQCESQGGVFSIPPLVCGSEVMGSLLEQESYDQYTIHLHRGDYFSIGVSSVDFDPELWVQGAFTVDGKAKIVLRNDDTGDNLNSYLSLICDVAGEYLISIGSMRGRGDYRIFAEHYEPDELLASFLKSSTRLHPGEALEGNLIDGADVYRIPLASGQRISVSMKAEGFKADLLLLGQLDPNGEYLVQLKDEDDMNDGYIEWTCTESGDYLIFANKEGNSGGPYTIEARMRTCPDSDDIFLRDDSISRWFLKERETIIPQQKYRVRVLQQFHDYQSNDQVLQFDARVVNYEIYPMSREYKLLSTQYILDSKTIHEDTPPHYRNGAQVISRGSIEEKLTNMISNKK
jgi:S1-C subfamily serine protease